MSWPKIEDAIVSLLTATDGLRAREIHERLTEIGLPCTFDDVELGLCGLCISGKVSWCGKVHLQKRGVTG